MNDVLLISEKTLKTESYINDNVDSCYILPAIRSAQDIGLQPLIGTALLDSLKLQIKSNDIKPVYKELLDVYIKPYLIYKVMADIQLPIVFKQRNSGIVNTSNEYENVVTLQDANSMATFYDNKATFYASRMSDYLCTNSNKIPEYRTIRNNSDMQSDKDSYNTGIYLGKDKKYVKKMYIK